MEQRTGTMGGNALDRELAIVVDRRVSAGPEVVYDVLADLRTHVEWAGERQTKTARLLTIEAPESPAVVGTEWRSTGADPMGRFDDRSVVTRADRPGLFEFVTEATLITKRGDVVGWTEVHRYEVQPDADGSLVHLSERITRISALPGMLRVFRMPVLSTFALKMSTKIARRAVGNLARIAEERATPR